MSESSLDHLMHLVEKAAGCLRELKTENVHLKQEIRRLEEELEGLRSELSVRRDEVAQLRRSRKRVRVLAERALDHLARIENSGDEVDVTG